MKKILFIVVSCLIVFAVAWYAKQFTSKKNEIDHFNDFFVPVKKLLAGPSKPSTISLITDDNDLRLYFQLQFVLAPHIVEHQNTTNDTIILMRKNDTEKTPVSLDQYNILYKSSYGFYRMMVLSKKH